MATPSEVVPALFAAFSARDVEAAVALCADDVTFTPEGTAEHVGRTEPYSGHAGLRQYFADVAEAWRSLTVTPADLRVAGSAVMAFGRAQGVTAAGEVVDAPVIWIFKLRDGLVSDLQVARTREEAERAAR